MRRHARRVSFHTAALVICAACATILAVASCGSEEATKNADGGAPLPPGSSSSGDGGNGGCNDGQALCAGACAPMYSTDNQCGAGSCAVACSDGKHCNAGTCETSKIEHVVLIVQENHSFDSYFGKYCQAQAGANPTCTTGRTCCEGAPKVGTIYTEPHGAAAYPLDDDTSNTASNFKRDRNHDQSCEVQQINGGAMDQFVSGASGASTCLGVGPSCSESTNFALADGATPTSTVNYYWNLADKSALADRYFQPLAGGSASNDIYFAETRFRFIDNQSIPNVAVGTSFTKTDRLCTEESLPASCVDNQRAQYNKTTIADLLLDHGKTFAVYADGFAAAYDARVNNACPDPNAATECPYHSCAAFGGHPVACHACVYDPSDIPFLYYARFSDQVSPTFKPTPYVKDYGKLKTDLDAKTLPNFSFIKARAFRNEHPNVSTIADGIAFVKSTVDMILASPTYKDNTLILLTWDEGGGFYDHVAPPKSWPTDLDRDNLGKPVPYGTRVPFLAIGAFAKAGEISHVTLEHSSVVRFLEWNFLTSVGQLGGRDTVVNNIGSVLDGTKTGLPVPTK